MQCLNYLVFILKNDFVIYGSILKNILCGIDKLEDYKDNTLYENSISIYGKFSYREIDKYMFTNHPYGQSVIGSFEDLDSASLEEFQEFYKNLK